MVLGAAAGAMCQLDGLDVKVFRLKGVSVHSVYEAVKDMKSQEGGMSVDERSNSLIVSDTPERLTMIADIIRRIDFEEKQVDLKVIIVEASEESLTRLGFSHGQLVLPQGRFRVFLDALKSDTSTFVRSEMSVKVMSNHPAAIQASSDEVFGEAVVRYPDATEARYPLRERVGEFLEVLPRVNDDDTITIIVRPAMISMNQENVPSERALFTQVSVANGDTVILGGSDTVSSRQQANRSFLGFKLSKDNSHSKNKVVIFLTAQLTR